MGAKKELGKKKQQASQKTVARTPRGLKHPSPELAWLLELANLLPPDYKPPRPPEIPAEVDAKAPLSFALDFIRELPPALKGHLLEHMHCQNEWEMTPKKGRVAFGALAPAFAALDRYRLVVEARERLAAIIDGDLRPTRVWTYASPSVITKAGKRVLRYDYAAPAVVHALQGIEPDYVARCAYGKCGVFFYAVRRGQPGCSPKHSDIVRKQRKRDRDEAARELIKRGTCKRKKVKR